MRRIATLLLCGLAIAGCEKNGVQDITGPLPSARVKFFNFGVGAPGVNFYANDTKMTAISSTSGEESTNGVNYGNVGDGGYYSAIAPGQYTITGRIAAETDKDLPISSLPATIADGKSYSFYQSGFYDPTTKTVDSFIVEDDYPAEIEYDKTYIRFVNAISNSEPMSLAIRVEDDEGNVAEGAVGGLVAYKSASDFVGFGGGGVADLVVRVAGSDTPVITRDAVSFSPGHVYTITARGDMTVTSDSDTNRPYLDNTANR